MEHIVSIAFNFDDKTVTDRIHETVERQVVDHIIQEVKDVIYNKSYYRNEYTNKEPLRNMVRCEVENIIEQNKEFIIQEASTILADKLSRTKAAKEMLSDTLTKLP